MGCGDGKCAGGSCRSDAPCCVLCGLAELISLVRLIAPPSQVVSLSETGATLAADHTIPAGCRGYTAVWVGGSGTLEYLGPGGRVLLDSVAAGQWHPLPYATKIFAQTSTATGVKVAFS